MYGLELPVCVCVCGDGLINRVADNFMQKMNSESMSGGNGHDLFTATAPDRGRNLNSPGAGASGEATETDWRTAENRRRRILGRQWRDRKLGT